ncbi:MAG: hypothetical protein F6J92_20285 [Symploca sp. SIO1A3]|nr:hypothetical protein [Symploca sp. SIO1A3]
MSTKVSNKIAKSLFNKAKEGGSKTKKIAQKLGIVLEKLTITIEKGEKESFEVLFNPESYSRE